MLRVTEQNFQKTKRVKYQEEWLSASLKLQVFMAPLLNFYGFFITHLTVTSSKIILAHSFSKETITSQNASFVYTKTLKKKTAASTKQCN